MKKNRILTYDFLRGVAIILMVVGHCILVYPINLHEILWCDLLYQWIYTFHMPLLFFVSGCVYKYGDFKSYISKKVNRILVPYIIFGIINKFLHSYGASLVNQHSELSTLPASLFLGYSNWFLFTILLIFITYPLIDRLIGNKIIQLIIALIILIFVPSSSFPGIFQLNNYIIYLPFFYDGELSKIFLYYATAKEVFACYSHIMFSFTHIHFLSHIWTRERFYLFDEKLDGHAYDHLPKLPIR